MGFIFGVRVGSCVLSLFSAQMQSISVYIVARTVAGFLLYLFPVCGAYVIAFDRLSHRLNVCCLFFARAFKLVPERLNTSKSISTIVFIRKCYKLKSKRSSKVDINFFRIRHACFKTA